MQKIRKMKEQEVNKRKFLNVIEFETLRFQTNFSKLLIN